MKAKIKLISLMLIIICGCDNSAPQNSETNNSNENSSISEIIDNNVESSESEIGKDSSLIVIDSSSEENSNKESSESISLNDESSNDVSWLPLI